MKKLIQIYPWINNEEKKEVEKVVNSTFLTEGKKQKNLRKVYQDIVKQNSA